MNEEFAKPFKSHHYKMSKNQNLWVTFYNTKHEIAFIMTSDKLNSEYFLYEVKDNILNKLNKSNTPVKLTEYADKCIKKG